MISLRKKLKRKWLTLFSVAVVIAVMVLAFPLNIAPVNEGYSGDGSVITITKGENRIVIGNTVGADTADYTCDGTDDDVQFQAAMTALPAAGGQIWVEAGTYNWAATTTVTRAIDNVSIIGVGGGVDFNTDDVTAAFSAGGDYWLFSNLQVDAGGITMGATTDWMWLNVEVNSVYYSLRTDSINIEDHSALHESGGADAIALDTLGATSDNTNLDATVGAHGLLRKLGGGTTNFLRADGAWAAPAGGGDVSGPASSTDEMIARHDGAGGKTLQDYTSNPPTISDTGDMNIDGDLDLENIVVSGDVDGRDVSDDGDKLDGIEAGATVYPDTGEQAFLDADHTKLDGIEALADITDAGNVAGAGALMDSGTDNIDDTHINWGAGAGPVDADDVPESATNFWASEDGADVTADNAPQAHTSSHAVSGGDTVFPIDPNADRYLMWDDDPGQLSWESIAGGGDVTGPGSSVDDAIVRFDGVTGKIIQDYTSNPPTISDTGDITVDGDLTADNIITAGNVDGVDVSTHSTAATGVHGVGGETILHTGDIDSSIQAWDDDLDDLAALTPSDSYFIVGDNSDWITETGATVRTSLGLTIDTDVPSQSSFDDHSARHIVSGTDTIFPADPGSDQYLMWDDAPSGELVWNTPGGSGDVVGPSSATDNAIVRFDETTGKLIQDYTSNPPTISDTGDMTIDGDATVDNLITAGNVDGVDVSVHATATTGVHGVGAETILHTGNIDSSIQAYDATLQSISGLGTAADKMLYTSGIDTWAEADLTSFARGMLDDVDAAAVRTTLGLVIGTDIISKSTFDTHAGDADAHGEPTITCDTASATADDLAFSIVGGEGIDTSGATTVVTVTGEDASTTNKGIASFDTQHFTVTSGDVDLNIDDTAVDDETDEPITSNWAYDHDADGSAHQSNVITITLLIDGGGSAISTGEAGHLEIPFACTITGWTILADQSGSIVIDVWNDTYANFPPDVADTIAGSEKPTLSTAQKNQDLTLSTWTTAVTAGDILAYNVDSVATVERVTLSIRATKT